jgi:hypothetical protein
VRRTLSASSTADVVVRLLHAGMAGVVVHRGRLDRLAGPDRELIASVIRTCWRSGTDGSREPLGLPGPRQQTLELMGLGSARDHALEHVGQPRQGLDPVQLCALRRCTGSVGASPTRQLSLQPEAPGADQEVTNDLKHFGKRPRLGASGPCGPQRERTPRRPRKCPMWEPTHQLNGEGRRRRASERDTPPPIPPG